jgi:hypothetical protein
MTDPRRLLPLGDDYYYHTDRGYYYELADDQE